MTTRPGKRVAAPASSTMARKKMMLRSVPVAWNQAPAKNRV
jgi:hypothetical protein